MKKDTIVGVCTSEMTWKHLQQYCFNNNFRANRNRFALAVVFNGESPEGIEYVKGFHPEFLFVRPKAGYDPAAYDLLIKSIPRFEYYILLHDDHWFHDKHWVSKLMQLMNDNPDTIAFGNLVSALAHKPPHYETIAAALGYEHYKAENFNHFFQGMAGIFRKQAIDAFIHLDGIPHIHRDIREVAEVCERLFSFILLDRGFKLGQIPPASGEYLMHRDWAERAKKLPLHSQDSKRRSVFKDLFAYSLRLIKQK